MCNVLIGHHSTYHEKVVKNQYTSIHFHNIRQNAKCKRVNPSMTILIQNVYYECASNAIFVHKTFLTISKLRNSISICETYLSYIDFVSISNAKYIIPCILLEAKNWNRVCLWSVCVYQNKLHYNWCRFISKITMNNKKIKMK